MSGIFLGIAAEAKQSGTGDLIRRHSINNIVSSDVNGITLPNRIRIIDVQYLLTSKIFIINRTVIEIDRIMLGKIISINVNNFSFGVECTMVKSHLGRTICPKCIIHNRAFESCVLEHCRGITPVEGLSINDAIINNGFRCMRKSHIISCNLFVCWGYTSFQRHAFESDTCASSKAEIPIALSLLINFRCTNIPRSFIFAGTNENQPFPSRVCICRPIATNFVIQCIHAFPKFNCCSFIFRCSCYSIYQCYITLISNPCDISFICSSGTCIYSIGQSNQLFKVHSFQIIYIFFSFRLAELIEFLHD